MNRCLSLFIILLGTMLLTGCWSQKELTDLGLVSAMGVDRNDNGKYVITLQIVNPGNVAATQKGGGQEVPVTVYSITGDSIVEASKKATNQVSRRLYYAHANLLVFGEELVKEEGFQTILDAIDRDQEFRTTTTVVIARDSKAADIVDRLTAIDKIPANKVIKSLKFAEERWGEFIDVNVQEVIRTLVTRGREPIISGVRAAGKKKGKKIEDMQKTSPDSRIETSGMAVLKNGKLIDWIEDEAARGTMFILDKVQSTGINVNWEEEKEAISYELIRQKTKVSAQMTNEDLPVITVQVRSEGDIGEVRAPINISDSNTIEKIEKLIEKEIEQEILTAVHHAQQNQSDIFGFGEKVHIAEPKAWTKLQKEWNDVHFPNLKVKVNVDAFVRRTGIRNKSYFLNMEND